MFENNTKQKEFVLGALIGGAVATLTSLLFTTQKGKQIQKGIADAIEDLEDRLSEKYADVKKDIGSASKRIHRRTAAAKLQIKKDIRRVRNKVKAKLGESSHPHKSH